MKTELDYKKVKRTAEEVAQMFRSYVNEDRYPQFVVDNQRNFEKIAEGITSDAIVLNNNRTGVEYVARVQGVGRDEKSGFEKLLCLYRQPELKVAPEIKLSAGKIVLSEEQIQTLKDAGRIDGVVSTDSGENYIIAVDKELNRLSFTNADKLRIPSKLHGVDLTEEQVRDLKQGKVINYVRPAPFDGDGVKKGDLLLLAAHYDPTLKTIRTTNVLDENGKMAILARTAQNRNIDKRAAKSNSQKTKAEKSEALQQVEKTIKTPKQKEVKNKTHKQGL